MPRLPHRGAPRRAVRRPGAPADRGRAQRPRAGRHPPHRPRLRGCEQLDRAVRARPARLDDARRGAVRDRARRRPRPQATPVAHLHLGPRGGRAAAHAAAAGPRPHDQRLAHLDPPRPAQLPARRGRQGAAGAVLRRLPRPAPRGPRARRATRHRHRPAARSRPGADPGDVADQPRDPGLPARPRLLAAVLRALPGDALRRHGEARLARGRRRDVPRRRLHGVPPARPRPGPRRRVAAPLRPGQQHLPARPGDVRHGVGRPDRARPGPGRPDDHAARLLRLHHGLDRRGARSDRRDGGAAALRPHRRARAAHRPGLPRRLRQAGRHRPRRRLRPAGVRGRRRRHQAHPADRPDHAVPVLRRVLARRELGDRRAAAADLRPGPPAAARADPRRRGRRHPGDALR